MSYDELADLKPDLEGEEDQRLRELIERASVVEALSQHPGWPLYVDYLKALSATSQYYVINGNVATIEEYKERVGYLRGIRDAIEAPALLQQRVSRMQASQNGG